MASDPTDGAAARDDDPTAGTAAGTAGEETAATAELGPDPAEGLRIIAAQTAKVRSSDPDERLIFGAWALAWAVGYLTLYLTASGHLGRPATTEGVDQPPSWAFIVFGTCIIGAMVFTIVHSMRANMGIRGVSTSFGIMYGWTWCIGFTGMGLMLGGLARAGAGVEVMALASNACACLLVGVLYMSGGAFWQDRQQYAIGVWIILVAAVAVFAGLPHTYLVMAVLGSGGFFAGMVLEHVRRVRRRAGADAGAGAGAESLAGRPVRP